MNITLRPVAISDLSTKYARSMDEKTIKHYSVSTSVSLISGQKPIDLVKEFIKKEPTYSGETIVEEVSADLVAPFDVTNMSMQLQDISDTLLKNDQDVKQSLEKVKFKNLLNDFFIPLTFKEKAVNFIGRWTNPFTQMLNTYLSHMFGIEYSFEAMSVLIGAEPHPHKSSKIRVFMDKIRIPYVPFFNKRREYNFAHYLSVAFESPDYEKAKEALLRDLRILQSNELIIGNLAMPSIMALADTIGNGTQKCVILCFPVLDTRKLKALTGLENVINPTCLGNLGIKYAQQEGGIGHLEGSDYSKKYDIHTVYVHSSETMSSDNARDAHIGSYQESLPTVEKAAEVTRQIIKNFPDELKKARNDLHIAVETSRQKISLSQKLVAKIPKKSNTKKTAKKSVKRKTKKRVRRK